MAQLFANNAESSLYTELLVGETSITLQNGHGARYPSPSGGDYFLATIDDEVIVEIVKCTARSGDVLTVVREQEGTLSPARFAPGAAVAIRTTRDTLMSFATQVGERAMFGIPPNYTKFDDDGSMEFFGAATLWDDIGTAAAELEMQGNGLSLNAAENQVEFITTSNLSDYLLKSVQMRHSWKIGSVIKPHVHWMQTSNAVPNFLFQYRWQTIGEAKSTPWINLASNIAALPYTSGTIHNIAHTAAGITPPANAKLSDIIQFRVVRDNANTSGVFAGADPVNATVSIISFDVHIEMNRVGSRNEFTA